MAKQKKTPQQLAEDKVAKRRLAELVAAGIAAARPPQAVSAADAASQQLQKELFQREVRAEYAKLVGPAGLGGANAPKSVTQLAQEQIGAERQKAAVALEVARLRGPGPAAPTMQELAADRAMKQVAAEQQRALDKREYERLTGTGEFSPRAGLLSRGYAGARSLLGAPAGLTAAFTQAAFNPTAQLVYRAARSAEQVADAQSTPFVVSQAQKDRASFGALPVLSDLVFAGVGAGEGLLGITRERNQVRETGVRQGLLGEFIGRGTSLKSSEGLEAHLRKLQADADQTFRLPSLKSEDRSTSLARQLYAEDAQLLPLRQQRVKAEREQTASDRKIIELDKAEILARSDVADIRKQLDARMRERREGIGSGRGERALNAPTQEAYVGAKEAGLNSQLASRTADLERLTQAGRSAKEDNTRRISALNFTRRELLEAESRQFDAREGQARGELGRLGDAGPLGRLQGLNAFNAIKQVGYDNVTPEERSAARQFFPNEVEDLAQRSGRNFIPEFRRAAGANSLDYRDDVEAVAGKGNKAREDARQLAELDVPRLSKGMADAMVGFVNALIDQFKQQMDDKIRLLQQNAGNQALGSR